MATRILFADVKTDKSLEDIKATAKEAFRTVGGTIHDTGSGFQINGGTQGVSFGFTANMRADINIKPLQGNAYRVECVINWSPNAIFWICLIIGIFVFGILWIVCILYLFVNPTSAYQQALNQIQGTLAAYASSSTLAPPSTIVGTPTSPSQALIDLKKLLDEGLITQKEFDQKKANILANM